MDAADRLQVEVVYALPDRQALIALELPAGSTVMAAVLASGLIGLHPELTPLPPLAVFGRLVAPDTALQPGDRVELLRPLQADPKDRRRERVQAVRRRQR